MKNRLIWLVAFLTILGTIPFSASQGTAATAAPKGVMKGSIHWVISADWLDPSLNPNDTFAQVPLYLFHDSLVKNMPDNRYSPCLAESWTISPDYKVYEFKLRKGVKFHNGDEMTAEDVVFTFQRYKSVAADLLKSKIQKMEAVNPYLFRITFKESFIDFFDFFFLPGTSSIGWIVPKKYIEKVGEDQYKRNPVGCGPYKFVEFKAGIRIVGEAFEGFWRKVPKIKRLEFYMVESTETRYAMIKKGEVDYSSRMDGVFYERVKKDPTLRLLTPTSPSNWLLHISAQWDPKSPWSDPRVRKAASLALDRKTLAEIYVPGASPAGELGLPGDPENLTRAADPYDPERAKKLMAEAGYAKGFHGGTFYPFAGPSWWQMGEQIANYWRVLGITLDTVQLGRPDYVARRKSGKMMGGVIVEPVVQPTVAGRMVYLFGGGNYSFGNYPEIQALWDQYNHSLDPKARKDLIQRIQQIMNEKTMFIYMVGSSTPSVLGPRPKGNPFKIQPLIYWPAPMEDYELND